MERLKEIDIIRTFVIILLVLYHALAPYCLPTPNPMKDFIGEENWHTVGCWKLLS